MKQSLEPEHKTTKVRRSGHFEGIWRYVVAFLSFCLAMCGSCSRTSVAEFNDRFELAALFVSHPTLVNRMLKFQLLDREGEPIPWCLLRLEWDEGGRMSFQTDQDGVIWLVFESDIISNKVTVSAESTRDARIRLQW